jgi:Glycosyl hydrolase family 20, catalytic domain
MNKINGIQLDFKYLMHNKEYLNKLPFELKKYGINTVLLEYEDKFPFRKYPFLQADDAFTEKELKNFLSTLRALNLRVIPLVQSLSHLEFALAHDELAHLREAVDIPTQICPSNAKSIEFILDLMKEVMEYHQEDELFHVGGDETWFLGTCPDCATSKERVGIINMWAEHQKPILDFVIKNGKRPIVWDDVFWKDFESIKNVDMPQETILMCWNYNITSLQNDASDSDDSEFGGSGQGLKQIEIYQNAGYECIGCPCCNYGQLFPRCSDSIGNTQAWAEKSKRGGMLGIINSSWAVFHTPFQAQLPFWAASAKLVDDYTTKIDDEWFGLWANEEFGTKQSGLYDAFETVGQLWEIHLPQYGRPFSPIGYGYMNMAMYYTGGQKEREKRGAYPLNWNEINFNKLYLKGAAEAKKCDQVEISEKLDELIRTYPMAIAIFTELQDKAVKNQDIADMYLLFAELKYLWIKIFSYLMRQDIDKQELLSEFEDLKEPLRSCLNKCYGAKGVERMMNVWWEPGYNALQKETKK